MPPARPLLPRDIRASKSAFLITFIWVMGVNLAKHVIMNGNDERYAEGYAAAHKPYLPLTPEHR